MESLKIALIRVANGLFYIAMTSLALLVALLSLEIFSRYFFGYSFTWVQEFSAMLICWVVFLGFGKVVIDREDIILGFVVDRLPKRFSRLNHTINAFLLILTATFMLYKTIALAIMQLEKSTPIMHIPSYYFTLPLAFALLVVLFHGLCEFIECIKGGAKQTVMTDLEERGVSNCS